MQEWKKVYDELELMHDHLNLLDDYVDRVIRPFVLKVIAVYRTGTSIAYRISKMHKVNASIKERSHKNFSFVMKII